MSFDLLKRLLCQKSKIINCSVVAVLICLLLSPSITYATSPKSANYQLNEWSIGGGGSDRSQSTNYKTETITDPTSGDMQKSANYEIDPGLIGTELANVPSSPALTNPSEYYNKLHLVINNGNNPSDATFAVAISSDNFITTYYVKADNTIGATLTASDWRTYASWGGASGINIIGLRPKTNYQVKVKAEQGDFTESRWSALAAGATAETDDPKITFDIDTAATDTETANPYIIAFGDLDAAVVNTATDKIWTDFGTNADNGGVVYVASLNQGLKSTAANHTIANTTGALSANTEGFGLVTASITQTDGGPFTADSPFAGSGNTVGSAGITLIPLATSLAPLTGGRNSVEVKAALNTLTPGGSDYTETLTLVAAATF
jgi:hypothetical protein